MGDTRLKVGPSPHIRSGDDISKIMWSVVISLLPAFGGVLYYFGWYAGLIVLVSVLSAVATEYVCERIRGVPITVSDGSAVVTGVLLAFVLPPNVPIYIPILGGIFAIAVAKHAFGGLGCNIWNPALAARAFLLASYPGYIVMSKWPILNKFLFGNINSSVDITTSATPLYILKNAPTEFQKIYSIKDLILGSVPGSLGETSALLLTIGAAYLIIKKYVNWRLPIAYILTVALLAVFLPYKSGGSLIGFWQPSFFSNPSGLLFRAVSHVFSGGLILGAFFMATDMVTSPLTSKGQVVFGIGCGILTAIIRLYGGYPEGVCYSILIMNTFVWVIDRYTRPRLFGGKSSN